MHLAELADPIPTTSIARSTDTVNLDAQWLKPLAWTLVFGFGLYTVSKLSHGPTRAGRDGIDELARESARIQRRNARRRAMK